MAENSITLGKVLRFSLLPGVIPRSRDLVRSGLGPFALFIALVFRAVRLLPDGHPYLNAANIGRFGVIDVITETGRFIYFNRKYLKYRNIDQIVVFLIILAALGLIVLQFVTLMFALFIPQAMAFAFPGGPSFTSPLAMFDTPATPPGVTIGGNQPFNDIAFMFLDRVFGVPGVFNSCIADNAANTCVGLGPSYGADPGMAVNDPGAFPWPYHIALQGIFQFYSIGLLVIAIFLLIYFTIVVVIETAQTGRPFGKRFDTVWAPLRLVMAAGLLIPISYGLNAGQYIVLYAAKAGSNFATNGWIGFNSMITGAGNSMAGQTTNLVAEPQIPDMGQLITFTSLLHACISIEDNFLAPNRRALSGQSGAVPANERIQVYQVRSTGTPTYRVLTYGSADYADAVQWAGQGDVIIRFGVQNDEYKKETGTVYPFCGEVTIPTIATPLNPGDPLPAGMAYAHIGASSIMSNYWGVFLDLVTRRTGQYYTFAGTTATAPAFNINEQISQHYVNAYMIAGAGPVTPTEPTPADRTALVNFFNQELTDIVRRGLQDEQGNTSNPFQMNGNLLMRGWAAAGVWYNRIAEVNGTFSTSAWNLPKVTAYPDTMMKVATEKQATQVNTPPNEMFAPYVQNQNQPITLNGGATEQYAATAYWRNLEWWQNQGPGFSTSTRVAQTGNVILDLINFMFGTSGLFSIRENANVHPLAQLSSIGKSLIERSITLMGVGLVGTALVPWTKNVPAKKSLEVLSGFAFSVLGIGASAGFILYYIIPFLPFIYFFFAAAGWVKAIFEAMVGVPLWALAHIRIDGSGLPGDAAMGGYFLILEIMLRPILIVFGLVASITIYASSVHMLNDIFNLAVSNVTGLNMDSTMASSAFTLDNLRGTLDTFFYTILYVVLVYMLGMSAFKLIDLIPGSMMRWLGASVSPFTDSGQEAASTLVSYGTLGSQMAFGQIRSAASSGIEGISKVGKALADEIK